MHQSLVVALIVLTAAVSAQAEASCRVSLSEDRAQRLEAALNDPANQELLRLARISVPESGQFERASFEDAFQPGGALDYWNILRLRQRAVRMKSAEGVSREDAQRLDRILQASFRPFQAQEADPGCRRRARAAASTQTGTRAEGLSQTSSRGHQHVDMDFTGEAPETLQRESQSQAGPRPQRDPIRGGGMRESEGRSVCEERTDRGRVEIAPSFESTLQTAASEVRNSIDGRITQMAGEDFVSRERPGSEERCTDFYARRVRSESINLESMRSELCQPAGAALRSECVRYLDLLAASQNPAAAVQRTIVPAEVQQIGRNLVRGTHATSYLVDYRRQVYRYEYLLRNQVICAIDTARSVRTHVGRSNMRNQILRLERAMTTIGASHLMDPGQSRRHLMQAVGAMAGVSRRYEAEINTCIAEIGVPLSAQGASGQEAAR